MSEMEQDRNWDEEARRDGWVPEEEFKGETKPAKFVDAETFVRNGEKIHVRLKDKIERVEEEVRTLRSANADFGKYKDAQVSKAKEEADQRIAELTIEREEAVTAGDGQTFTRADNELERLRTQTQPESNPLGEAWARQNTWYGSDDRLTGYADGIFQRIIDEGYTGEAYYKELTRRTKDAFPEAFENKSQQRPVSVEEGGHSEVRDTQTHDYDNLPADAKAACDRFVSNGLTTKEDYVATYDWD